MRDKTEGEMEIISKVIADLFNAENVNPYQGATILGTMLIAAAKEINIEKMKIFDLSTNELTILEFSVLPGMDKLSSCKKH